MGHYSSVCPGSLLWTRFCKTHVFSVENLPVSIIYFLFTIMVFLLNVIFSIGFFPISTYVMKNDTVSTERCCFSKKTIVKKNHSEKKRKEIMLLENKESGKLIEQAHRADSRLAGFLIDKSPAHALSLSL